MPTGWSNITGAIIIYLKVTNDYNGTLTVKAYSDLACTTEITGTLNSALIFHNKYNVASVTLDVAKMTTGGSMSSFIVFLTQYNAEDDSGTVISWGQFSEGTGVYYENGVIWGAGSNTINYNQPGTYTYYFIEMGTFLDDYANGIGVGQKFRTFPRIQHHRMAYGYSILRSKSPSR